MGDTEIMLPSGETPRDGRPPLLSHRAWWVAALAAAVAMVAGVVLAWVRAPAPTPVAAPSPGPTPSTSLVAGQTLAVAPAYPGVPVPVRGYYWGGTNNHDTSTVPGCALPSTYSGAGQVYGGLECKINWAAKQLKLTAPAATPGRFHTSMARAYLDGDLACRDQQSRLKPGGDIYGLATAPGRRVLMLSTRCGPWKALADGGGRAPEDSYVRQLVDLVEKFPVPVILVMNHEPEDEACDPATGMGTPDDFRRAFRQFATDVRTEDARDGRISISLGWILMNATFLTGAHGDHLPFTGCDASTAKNTRVDNPLRNPENWYPGDDAVDWIAADVYTHGTDKSLRNAVKPFVNWVSAPCPQSHPLRDWTCTAARAHRPLALGEFGPGLAKTAPPTQAQKAAWLNQFRSDLNNPAVHEFSRIKAFAYWSSGGQNVIDMPPDPTHPALRAYTLLTLQPLGLSPQLAPAPG